MEQDGVSMGVLHICEHTNSDSVLQSLSKLLINMALEGGGHYPTSSRMGGHVPLVPPLPFPPPMLMAVMQFFYRYFLDIPTVDGVYQYRNGVMDGKFHFCTLLNSVYYGKFQL